MSPGSRPFVLVISAPSGAGKTSLARALVDRKPHLTFSISATTRPRRPEERDGEDYLFVDGAEFDRMLAAGELVEWAEVHGRRYGTPRRGIEAALARGEIPVLDIDVQGARQIRRVFADAVLVFILPPSGNELVRRLASRASEDPDERRRRLDAARRELPAAVEFDYVVVNDAFDAALAALEALVTAETRRVPRLADIDAVVARLDAEIASLLERSS